MGRFDVCDTGDYNSEQYGSMSGSSSGEDVDDFQFNSCDEDDDQSSGKCIGVDDRHVGVPRVEDIRLSEFSSDEEAYVMYVQYAKSMGFGVRKSDVGRDENNTIIRRTFVCNREGLREKKHYCRVDRKREHKPETRTDCRAKLMLSLDRNTGKWIVRKLEEEHNHTLTPQTFVHLIPNHRRITDADKAQIDSMRRHGMRTCRIMGFMAGQAGGYKGVGFSKKDLYNYVDRGRRDQILEGDAAAAISYLQGKADSDPMTVARYTCTTDDCLGNLLWADGLCRADYQYFGDVLAFDSTYKKNKYNKPLVIFSGANHHRQTCIFGFALLADECTDTYKWLLEEFVDVMGGKEPVVVVTDGDEAMREAIRRVFPRATHRLCAWHLQKNATTNIKDPAFCKAFKKSIYANFDKDKFEHYWQGIVEEFRLGDNSWVRKAYERKEMWATAYLRDKFSAGIRTTSRCEGINAFIKTFIKSRYSLLELVQSLEHVVVEYRNNELVAQYQSVYTEPVLSTGLDSIERAAGKTYTREIFKEVKKEIEMVASLIVAECVSISTTKKYKMVKYGDPGRCYDVLYDRTSDLLECECHYWNSQGIPCRHMFCVMKDEQILEIPDKLILKRWCKNAKTYEEASEGEVDTEKACLLRYSALCSASMWMAYLASRETMYFRKAMDEVVKLSSSFEVRCSSMQHASIGGSSNKKKIGDPVVAKTKGAPRGPNDESKKRRCSNCSQGGHTKRNCPVGRKKTTEMTAGETKNGSVDECDEDEVEDQQANDEEAKRFPSDTAPSWSQACDKGGECAGASGVVLVPQLYPMPPPSGHVFFGGQQIYQYFNSNMHPRQQEVAWSKPPLQACIHNLGSEQSGVHHGHQWHLQNIMGFQGKGKEHK